MKILTWSFNVLAGLSILIFIFFDPVTISDSKFGNSSTKKAEKSKSSIILKWKKSGSITALPNRWTIIPGKPGYNFESDDDPYKVEVKYRWRGKWKEYKGGSPNMTAFAYKSKTGKPEMFKFRFTK